jgi:hypothetical protein
MIKTQTWLLPDQRAYTALFSLQALKLATKY